MYRLPADRKNEAARVRQITADKCQQYAEEPAVPIVSLAKCEWHPKEGKLTLASEYVGMPRKLDVISHHTGKVVRFTPVRLGDPQYDEDGYDGERAVYRPNSILSKAKCLVIYNQY
jgi:hypothetical protein